MNQVAFEKFLKKHLERRPYMGAADVFKLLYQGVFGVGHIMGNKAWDSLIEEADRVSILEGYEDPLLEDISPDCSLVRVNLRPFLKKGYSLKKLFRAMKETKVNGNSEEFLEYWRFFTKIVEQGDIEIDLSGFEKLDREARKEVPKTVHHTKQYKDAYYPAYRVVERKALLQAIKNIEIL